MKNGKNQTKHFGKLMKTATCMDNLGKYRQISSWIRLFLLKLFYKVFFIRRFLASMNVGELLSIFGCLIIWKVYIDLFSSSPNRLPVSHGMQIMFVPTIKDSVVYFKNHSQVGFAWNKQGFLIV
jgi:hypothetical protein